MSKTIHFYPVSDYSLAECGGRNRQFDDCLNHYPYCYLPPRHSHALLKVWSSLSHH